MRLPYALVVATLCFAGCREVKQMAVPSQGGGECRVALGQERTHVLLRCGSPCHSAQLEEGKCAPGNPSAADACPNKCDIYQDSEVCYAEAAGKLKIVSIDLVDREWGRFEWCFWPSPPLPKGKPRK